MAPVRMTLEAIKARAKARTPDEAAAFRRRMDETTEEDIRRHMIEDGEDPDAEPCFAPPVLAQDVRKKLGLTQPQFAELLGIPVATLRNWEQNRFTMEPAAQTRLKLVDREPDAVLRARALASLADPAPTLSEAEADARLGALFGAVGEPRD